MKKLLIGLGLSITLLAGISVAGNVTIKTSSLIKKDKEWIQPKKVVPGKLIKYINTVENSGTEEIQNLEVINKIPKDLVYLSDTALCKSKCNILFSIDGKTFSKKSNLFIKDTEGKKVKAKASDYKAIKWQIKKLTGNSKTTVEYKAKVK